MLSVRNWHAERCGGGCRKAGVCLTPRNVYPFWGGASSRDVVTGSPFSSKRRCSSIVQPTNVRGSFFQLPNSQYHPHKHSETKLDPRAAQWDCGELHDRTVRPQLELYMSRGRDASIHSSVVSHDTTVARVVYSTSTRTFRVCTQQYPMVSSYLLSWYPGTGRLRTRGTWLYAFFFYVHPVVPDKTRVLWTLYGSGPNGTRVF